MKNSLKKITRSAFTLIELLVSMVVFAVIMLVLMQFVGAAQKLWIGIDQRNSMYDAARIAMDFMSRDIQSIFYEAGKVPFMIDNGDGSPASSGTRICFVTMTDMLPSGATSRLVVTQYFLNPANCTLKVYRIGNTSASWSNFYSSTSLSAVFGSSLPSAAGAGESLQVIAPYVVGLTFTGYDYKYSNVGNEQLPYVVKIDLTMLDKDSFKKWTFSDPSHSNTSSEFLINNKRTFTRIVIIGNRGQYY